LWNECGEVWRQRLLGSCSKTIPQKNKTPGKPEAVESQSSV
jgi:hypothetical protein